MISIVAGTCPLVRSADQAEIMHDFGKRENGLLYKIRKDAEQKFMMNSSEHRASGQGK